MHFSRSRGGCPVWQRRLCAGITDAALGLHSSRTADAAHSHSALILTETTELIPPAFMVHAAEPGLRTHKTRKGSNAPSWLREPSPTIAGRHLQGRVGHVWAWVRGALCDFARVSMGSGRQRRTDLQRGMQRPGRPSFWSTLLICPAM